MITIFRKALYGLKSSGAAFYANLAETLNGIGLMSTKAEPDVWYFPVVKPNGFEYYEYILCYIDDILCISHDLGIALGQIQAVFKFKGDNIEQPKIYLGVQIGKMIVNISEGWYMSAEKYVRSNVDNVDKNTEKINQSLPTSWKTPIMYVYRPENDTLTQLKAEGVKK